ncbi:uncharacterized protein RHOBADRAFT_52230, partial [Rhodotorula graminis WP1]
ACYADLLGPVSARPPRRHPRWRHGHDAPSSAVRARARLGPVELRAARRRGGPQPARPPAPHLDRRRRRHCRDVHIPIVPPALSPLVSRPDRRRVLDRPCHHDGRAPRRVRLVRQPPARQLDRLVEPPRPGRPLARPVRLGAPAGSGVHGRVPAAVRARRVGRTRRPTGEQRRGARGRAAPARRRARRRRERRRGAPRRVAPAAARPLLRVERGGGTRRRRPRRPRRVRDGALARRGARHPPRGPRLLGPAPRPPPAALLHLARVSACDASRRCSRRAVPGRGARPPRVARRPARRPRRRRPRARRRPRPARRPRLQLHVAARRARRRARPRRRRRCCRAPDEPDEPGRAQAVARAVPGRRRRVRRALAHVVAPGGPDGRVVGCARRRRGRRRARVRRVGGRRRRRVLQGWAGCDQGAQGRGREARVAGVRERARAVGEVGGRGEGGGRSGTVDVEPAQAWCHRRNAVDSATARALLLALLSLDEALHGAP